MRPLPHSPRNGEAAAAAVAHHTPFQSTVSIHKLKRFNSLILIFRVVSFCSCLASAVFMVSNSASSSSPRWFDFDAYRYVFAANSIVAIYSLFEIAASLWEISRNTTLFPEVLQVWFDFGHDQVFAYVLMSADSAGAAVAKTLKGLDKCKDASAFCVQSDISISLGFVGFLFLGFSGLLSGFRVACFIIKGSRFHL